MGKVVEHQEQSSNFMPNYQQKKSKRKKMLPCLHVCVHIYMSAHSLCMHGIYVCINKSASRHTHTHIYTDVQMYKCRNYHIPFII
jgi:hypothetical protein